MMHLLLSAALVHVPASASPIDLNDRQQGVSMDTTVAITAAKNLSLDLRSGGSVKIVGGTGSVVRIRVFERGRLCGDCRVELQQTNEGLQLRSHKAAPGRSDLRFEIDVPAHFDLQLASAGGAVQIEGVDGQIRGQTESGELELRRLSGAVDLKTARGDIVLRESFVNGRVHTSGGRVLVEDVTGLVDATSEKGRVTQRRVTRPSAGQ